MRTRVALPLLLACAVARAGIDWKPDAATAEADARKNKKLLLVFITGPAT